ncbi:MAG: helix-hairpin-helix domain-containing protein [Geobacteraceae bacterium]
MDPVLKKLTRLRGVGDVIANRFRDAGLDTFEKIVAAGADGLSKIRGINLRAIPAILAQAAELVVEETEKTVDQVVDRTIILSGRAQEMAQNMRDRFGEELKGKTGKKVEKELLKIVGFLDRPALKRQKKKVLKGLAKAEKKLVIVEDAGLKKIRKCLKKARKSLSRISSNR